MAQEIIISVEKGQTQTAIVEDGELAELHVEQLNNRRTVGDIYLGRISRVVPGIRAAFVDIGQEKDAFLHYTDLDEYLKEQLSYAQDSAPDLQANPPTLADPEPATGRRAYGSPRLLKAGRRILVQVLKEPFSSKGTRVTTRITLAGRFVVLVPIHKIAAVSRRIASQKERRRLRNLARRLRPEGCGVIVRTVATGKDREAIETDMKLLLDRWRRLEKKIARANEAPVRVHSDLSMVSSIVRDLFSNDFDRVLVGNRRLYERIRRYIHAVAPHLEPAVKLYKGKRPIFEATRLQESIDEVFSNVVSLPSGGYLIFEETEAMHVIDVNTGSSVPANPRNRGEWLLRVNLEAARVIAKQLRLRDLAGITVIDFIDMRDTKSRQKVYEVLVEGMEPDRSAFDVLPMSEIGIIQITRQRTRQNIRPTRRVELDKAAPFRNASPRDLVASMESWLGAQGGGWKKFLLRVHPFTAAYLKQGFYSVWLQWWWRYKVRIELREEWRMNVMDYRFESPRKPRPNREQKRLNGAPRRKAKPEAKKEAA